LTCNIQAPGCVAHILAICAVRSSFNLNMGSQVITVSPT
jgi:hypothetical protein